MAWPGRVWVMGREERGVERPVERLRLSAAELEAVVDHLRSVYPAEGCGLLAVTGDDERVVQRFPITNIATDPQRHYLGEPVELLEAFLEMERRGWRLGAIYHSHPHGPAYPSHEDIRQAYYPAALSLLVSLAQLQQPEVRLFALRDGQVAERTLTIETVNP